MILTWLSLTFLMIPGQPPIIITLALALAAIELARRQVIVKRLQGAETLGSVTAVLSDKTGTMTENRMALSAVVLGDGELIPALEAQRGRAGLWNSFMAQALPAIPENTNDPTDQAIRAAAHDVPSRGDREAGHLVRMVGFAQGRVYRALEYQQDSRWTLYVAGSPELMLSRSVAYQRGDQRAPFGPTQQNKVRNRLEELAAQGKRITAYAYRDQSVENTEPNDLTLIGLAVLDDPIRPEVRGAISRLAQAGVQTIMVTGDNPATALSVAREVGLNGDRALTGPELKGLSDAQLQEAARDIRAFARTTPEDKLRLARALQAEGETVAVTGDGVNDAPALRAADGVAVERKAYDDFRKGITYYLVKAVLLTVFLVPLALGVPFPFAPIQIIAIELLIDLASSTIFVSEGPEPGLMQRPPRRQAKFLS